MSIDHSIVLAGKGDTDLRINLSGIDGSPQDASMLAGNLYAYSRINGAPKFTCSLSVDELRRLHAYLHTYSVIRDNSVQSTGRIIEIAKDKESLQNLLVASNHDDLVFVLEGIVSSKLSRADLNIVTGRRACIGTFAERLSGTVDYSEPDWQKFFSANSWIFGYGLAYKYLNILQKEAHISKTALDGSGGVITDFLMTDRRFTKIVELKKPSTPLFELEQNRSDSWRLSRDLIYAVSQILAQKANWELEAQQGKVFDAEGKPIHESAFDVECILIIGHSSQFEGPDRELQIKKKTFELYRRNLRHIEIILYDELLERAQCLVQQDESTKEV